MKNIVLFEFNKHDCDWSISSLKEIKSSNYFLYLLYIIMMKMNKKRVNDDSFLIVISLFYYYYYYVELPCNFSRTFLVYHKKGWPMKSIVTISTEKKISQ